MLPEKSWTPIWSRTRASSNCAKWPSMARSICCEASARRATTNSRKCGQYIFELRFQPVSWASAFAVAFSVARACRKASDARASRSDRLDPFRERLHKALQEFAGAIVGKLAVLIEELVGMADIGFGLLHGRHVQKHKRLPEMMIGAEGPDRAR